MKRRTRPDEPAPIGAIVLLSLDCVDAVWAILGIADVGEQLRAWARNALQPGVPDLGTIYDPWQRFMATATEAERNALSVVQRLDRFRERHPERHVWTDVLRRWQLRPTSIASVALSAQGLGTLGALVERHDVSRVIEELESCDQRRASWNTHLVGLGEYGLTEVDDASESLVDLCWAWFALRTRQDAADELSPADYAELLGWAARVGRQFGGGGRQLGDWRE